MDVDIHHAAEHDAASVQRYRSIVAPRPAEGISNALRLAFDHADTTLPAEFDLLLQQLN